MGDIFSAIKIGQYFYIDGEPFKKTSGINYEDVNGYEIYLDPLREAKMTTTPPPTAAEVATALAKPKKTATDDQAFITDPQTRVMTKNPNFGKKAKKTKVATPKQK